MLDQFRRLPVRPGQVEALRKRREIGLWLLWGAIFNYTTTPSLKLGAHNPQPKLSSQIAAKRRQIQQWFDSRGTYSYHRPTQQYHRRPLRGTPSPTPDQLRDTCSIR